MLGLISVSEDGEYDFSRFNQKYPSLFKLCIDEEQRKSFVEKSKVSDKDKDVVKKIGIVNLT